jgi:hypothetical protein
VLRTSGFTNFQYIHYDRIPKFDDLSPLSAIAERRADGFPLNSETPKCTPTHAISECVLETIDADQPGQFEFARLTP